MVQLAAITWQNSVEEKISLAGLTLLYQEYILLLVLYEYLFSQRHRL